MDSTQVQTTSGGVEMLDGETNNVSSLPNIVGSKFGLSGQNNLGLGQPVSEEELVTHI